jgi:hypothetical protein
MNTQLSHVSSEGGPLLLGDYENLRHWNGNDFALFQKACELRAFAVREIAFAGRTSLVWDFGGADTAYLAKSDPAATILLRYWSDTALSDTEIADLVQLDAESLATATLTVTSGRVLILWAAEDARDLIPPVSGYGTPKGLSIGDGGCFTQLPIGKYEAVASHYFKGKIEVAALRLVRL